VIPSWRAIIPVIEFLCQKKIAFGPEKFRS
jgi:hypothetical protein